MRRLTGRCKIRYTVGMKTKDAIALRCSHCGRNLPADNFRLRHRTNDRGHSYTYREQPCRKCRNAKQRERMREKRLFEFGAGPGEIGWQKHVGLRWIRTCEHCGSVFLAHYRHPNAKYCSRRCYRKANRKPRVVRECEICGGEFVPAQSNYIVCSRKCREELNRIRSRIRMRNVRAERREKLPLFHWADLQRLKRWQENNPARVQEKLWKHKANRRAAIKENGHCDLTAAQWREILDRYDHRCAYCGERSDKLTMDHVVPISRGGEHTASNIVPACMSCNSSKGAKNLEEWLGVRAA